LDVFVGAATTGTGRIDLYVGDANANNFSAGAGNDRVSSAPLGLAHRGIASISPTRGKYRTPSRTVSSPAVTKRQAAALQGACNTSWNTADVQAKGADSTDGTRLTFAFDRYMDREFPCQRNSIQRHESEGAFGRSFQPKMEVMYGICL